MSISKFGDTSLKSLDIKQRFITTPMTLAQSLLDHQFPLVLVGKVKAKDIPAITGLLLVTLISKFMKDCAERRIQNALRRSVRGIVVFLQK